MKTKRWIAGVVLALSLAVGGLSMSGAYFNASKDVTNNVTFGKVAVSIEEKMLDGGQEVPFVNPTGVTPGQEVSKIAYVKNEGSVDAWVRAKITVSVEDDAELTTAIQNLVTLNTSDSWVKSGDYYYYNAKAAANTQIADAVLKSVTFSTDMGNEYADKKVNIVVKAEAVQADNNGTSAQTAAGWPE